MDFKRYQDILFEKAIKKHKATPFTEEVKSAFFEIPRHLFVPIFRSWENTSWTELTDENIEENLEKIYTDYPLVIFGEQEDFKKPSGSQFISTISQPSFVLRMIDMLDIKKGHRIFELGGGSGWNAALMSRIIGNSGKIISVEIIPELIERAKKSIDTLNIKNIEFIHADGGDCSPEYGKFDRAVFTAGAFDLPRSFYDQIIEDGLLLFVLKNKGDSDNLILLKKTGHIFKSISITPCGFVPLVGKYHINDLEETSLEDLLQKHEISNDAVAEKDFWWGGTNKEEFFWSSSPIKTFLTITESKFVPILLENKEKSFGILDSDSNSLCVAYYDRIVSYGNTDSARLFIDAAKNWMDVGMPSPSNFCLKVMPLNKDIEPNNNEWVVHRSESTFIWSC